MLPQLNSRFDGRVCVWLFLISTTAFGQLEPQGLLVYQEPSTSNTEALEYHSFRQENALYVTIVTLTGERKQLKAGWVVAALSYPPASFDADFVSTAQRAIEKIDSLEKSYPLVRQELQKTRGKWTRALSAFNQAPTKPAEIAAARDRPVAISLPGGVFQDARISSATRENVTVTHASGVTTFSIAQLTAAQVLALNRASDKVQLPLGISLPESKATRNSEAAAESPLTLRIETAGRAAVNFCAVRLGVSAATFSAWTFFVVLPAAVLLLLLGWIASARRAGRAKASPRAR